MGRAKEEPEKRNTVRQKVFIVSEGKTEFDYFSRFNNKHKELGVFSLECLDKTDINRNLTKREDLVDLAQNWVRYVTRGEITPYTYATLVLNRMWIGSDLEHRFDNSREKEKVRVKFWNMRTKIVDTFGNLKNISKLHEGRICDFVSAKATVVDIIEKSDLGVYFDPYCIDDLDLTCPKVVTFDPRIDRIFVVFDRDDDGSVERSDERYRMIFSKCYSSNPPLEVLLSTPRFEFWLLLHHKNVDVTQYGSTNNYGEEINRDLKRLDGIVKDDEFKFINQKRFDKFYANTFDFAVDRTINDPHLFTEPELLLNNIGTNVGIKLRSLFDEDKSEYLQ